jgi:hypothetical protein
MTTEEAIALANQVKRQQQQQPLDKLQRSAGTAEDLSAGAAALAKSFGTMGEAVAAMAKRLDHLEDAVEYLKGPPGQPLRRFQA